MAIRLVVTVFGSWYWFQSTRFSLTINYMPLMIAEMCLKDTNLDQVEKETNFSI